MIDMKPMERGMRSIARDEARILQVLSHPNVIQFHDVFKDKELNLNIVMEWADGGDLSMQILERRKNNEHFSEDQILDYFT